MSRAANGTPKRLDVMTPLDVAYKYLYVRESPKGSNRGPEIDRWLQSVGSSRGSPWCAAFAYGCYVESDIPWSWAKSGRVQTLVESGVLAHASTAKPGDLIVFYFKGLGRYAHIAICQKNTKKFLTTIDGNTSDPSGTGSEREGWGVWERTRVISGRIKVLRPRVSA